MALLAALCSHAQPPRSYTSSELLHQLKKLNVLGSVLYVAAHPDDENTRLLAYLANEKQYRTGYLSLTRGDGGQNLIGDEQGIDLGLIRTQELLAARRVDGAEQFFSRAYDFGYSKSPEETMRMWGHDEILSDVVWIIRKFRPDVIICRFPTTGEGGHGHHTASAMLAEEAYDAAADPNRFPEQLSKGVTTWQAKRLLWNTFNFGSSNTQREDQFKVDVGAFNPLLGKSYGEMAAQSRSQHKSQGFGVPSQRGTVIEYFKTLKGTAPVTDLMDGVDVSWNRLTGTQGAALAEVNSTISNIISSYDVQHPEATAAKLLLLQKQLIKLQSSGQYWAAQKSMDVNNLLVHCLGIYFEATTSSQLHVKGDSIKVNIVLNSRSSNLLQKAAAAVMGANVTFDSIKQNVTYIKTAAAFINETDRETQPYWLENGLEGGRFNVTKQDQIGLPQSAGYIASLRFVIEDVPVVVYQPVNYKFTDPVKGELFQPIQVVNPAFISTTPSLVMVNTNDKKAVRTVHADLQFNKALKDSSNLDYYLGDKKITVFQGVLNPVRGDKKRFDIKLPDASAVKATSIVSPVLRNKLLRESQEMTLRKISYDHIPDIYYNYRDVVKIVPVDLKTAGSAVGYIVGAGDKVPEALQQMGYTVTLLKEDDITPESLKRFDAVVTGVRAYNTNEWMNNVYETLMNYVKEGGVLLVQYNTSNQIGPVKAKIAPYPFNISRSRITDETAKVDFIYPDNDLLRYPNSITTDDFNGWVQERSIYHADKIDSNYKAILSMADPGEKADKGALITADYGKGRFMYTGLAFFRELPAGVPGAYRLFANLIAKPRKHIK